MTVETFTSLLEQYTRIRLAEQLVLIAAMNWHASLPSERAYSATVLDEACEGLRRASVRVVHS